MKIKPAVLLMSAFVFGLFVTINLAQEEQTKTPAEPVSGTIKQETEKKLTIKDIMTKAHGKDGLTKKVATGKATAEEKKELQKLYEALGKLNPPKGDAKSWTAKTDKLIEAAKLAVKGDPSAAKKLKTASDCKSCHSVHKK